MPEAPTDVVALSAKLEAWTKEFRTVNDARLEKLEKQGGGVALMDEKLLKMHEDMCKLETTLVKRLQDIERAKTEPPAPPPATKEGDLQRKAFNTFLRKGFERMGPDELKALQQTNDSGGGYLCPPEEVAEILKTVTEFSPIRSLARVKPTSRTYSKHPKRTGTFSAQWVSEQGTRAETTGLKYGMEEIPNHEMYAICDISNAEMEDAEFDMEAEIRSEFGEQFGVAEGTAFISGSGTGKPEGILTSTAIQNWPGIDTSAHYLQPDDLIIAFGMLKGPYAANATFLLKRSVLFKVRTVKAASTGEYLMLPFASGMPPNILGRPFATDENLEADGTASKIVALVGDFRRGYVISDRVPIAVVRDNLTQATAGNVRFIGRKRVGGQVVMGEAIVKVTTA